jgi:Asp-tRNA(Asn)/Glu-tRNA(Gln) amidotransferase A subunit family amidase
MSVDLDLAYTPALTLAERIRRRAISPVEVVRNCLERIAAVNPTLNCFCFVYPEESLARAREAERTVMAGRPLGPLHGVPIATKDLTPTRGKRTTKGSYAYEHWLPDADAIVVERLLAAGAIMVGKTTTPEFAHASVVPSGFTPAGLPTGLQIVGRRFDDLGVLRIGRTLEGALGWTTKRPPT